MKDFLWLKQASQGRKLRHGTSFRHPYALTQTAPADSAGKRGAEFALLNVIQCRFALLPVDTGTETACQGTRKFGTAAKMGCRSWESWRPVQGSGFFFRQGLKFSGSLAQRQGTARQLPRGMVPLREAASPSHHWGPVGLCSPSFGKGESTSITLPCCACFDYSLLCSSEIELDQ